MGVEKRFDMSLVPISTTGFSLAEDQIFVTDLGIDHIDRAFYHLAFGRHVFDHRWKELTVQSLERRIDPNDVMNPMILRGTLWKKVHTRFWQVDDGHQLGPMPSQPGLDAYCSSKCILRFHVDGRLTPVDVQYADRRARQAVKHLSQSESQSQTPLRAERTSTAHEGAQSKQIYVQLPAISICRRRTGSESNATSNRNAQSKRNIRKTQSANDINGDQDDAYPDLNADDEEEKHPDHGQAVMGSDNEGGENESLRLQQGRKVSMGEDSGIDLGDEESDLIYGWGARRGQKSCRPESKLLRCLECLQRS